MVHHIIIPPQHRVFVSENIETMRAGSYYFFYLIPVQKLDILVRHHLKHELISRSPRRIARTHFFLSENGITDAYLVQNCNKSPCNFLRPLVETARTTDPK